MTPRIPYTRPSITDLEVAFAADATRIAWGERAYEYVIKFQNAFQDHLGVKYAMATSSCTGALHLGFAAMGLGSDDEVILADTNWIASAAPITYLGAKPVFVDIDPNSWCIDPEQVERAITQRTKAILAVHLYGNLCDMDSLLKLGERYGIPVIEDTAEAIGAVYHGKRAGSMGYFSTFSFHGSKTMSTGEGGMLLTNDADLFDRIVTLANHGRSRRETRQFWPERIGYKYRMSDIQAAIGCAQLQRVDELVSRKREILHFYRSRLSQYSCLSLNVEPEGCLLGAWMPTVEFSVDSSIHRDDLNAAFERANIDARGVFYPLSGLDMFGGTPANPRAQSLCERAVNLPSFHDISNEQLERVARVIMDVANRVEP